MDTIARLLVIFLSLSMYEIDRREDNTFMSRLKLCTISSGEVIWTFDLSGMYFVISITLFTAKNQKFDEIRAEVN